MRDKLPTLPCDLTEYAWDHTGPESWSAAPPVEIVELDSEELKFLDDYEPFDIEVEDPDDLEEALDFSIDEDSCIAGPLIGVRGSSVPRATHAPSDYPRLELDQREELILSLIERCSSVNELLDTSGLPESETLAILCDLCAREIVMLERAG